MSCTSANSFVFFLCPFHATFRSPGFLLLLNAARGPHQKLIKTTVGPSSPFAPLCVPIWFSLYESTHGSNWAPLQTILIHHHPVITVSGTSTGSRVFLGQKRPHQILPCGPIDLPLPVSKIRSETTKKIRVTRLTKISCLAKLAISIFVSYLVCHRLNESSFLE